MNLKPMNVLAIAAVLLGSYYLLKMGGVKEKKVDDANPKEPVKAPKAESASADGFGEDNGRLTVADLSKKSPVDIVKPDRVPYKPKKPCRKEPIYLPAYNAIPNAFDRTVGMPLAPRNPQAEMYAHADGAQMYASFGGSCSSDIQTACRCMTAKTERYKLDIPKLP